jgi:hypothetical protein
MDRDAQLDTDVDKKINVLGISSTNLNDDIAPRKSTSEQALVYALVELSKLVRKSRYDENVLRAVENIS